MSCLTTLRNESLNLDVSSLKFYEGSTYLQKAYGLCKDSICNDLKFVLGSNVKGSNNKFVERGCKRTRRTPKEKRSSSMFIDRFALI